MTAKNQTSLQSKPLPLHRLSRLSFKRAPLLYKYPDSNPKTVRNIAVQLLKNDKFFIKVCHLMNILNLDPPFEEDFLQTESFLKNKLESFEKELKEKYNKMKNNNDVKDDIESLNEEQRISFVLNGPTLFQKFLNLFTTMEQLQNDNEDYLKLAYEIRQLITTSNQLIIQLKKEKDEMAQKLKSFYDLGVLNNNQMQTLRNDVKQKKQKDKVVDYSHYKDLSIQFENDQPSDVKMKNQTNKSNVFKETGNQEEESNFDMKSMFRQAPEIKTYEDVDEYLKDLNNEVMQNDKAKLELDNLDYDIWFAKQQQQGNELAQLHQEKQVSNSIYVKNIDKKIERKDFINIMLPFFDNNQKELESQCEIIIMKKGKMRGQGFINFTNVEKAVEIFDAMNGIVMGQKALSLEFSSNKRQKTNN